MAKNQDGRQSADLVVVGSGAAGLTAALTAAMAGLSVIVLETARHIGGTSARSSGTVWIPDNHHMRTAGMTDDRRKAELYLAGLTGNSRADALWRRFLDHSPAMVRDLEGKSALALRPYMSAPDYRQDVAGAALGGRPLEPLAFDGRALRGDFSRLASPIRELMLFGGLMVTRGEAAELLKADRSLSAALLGLRLVARFLRDRMSGYRRGTRLVLGNALVARLLKCAMERGVSIRTGMTPLNLIREDERITGVVCKEDGKCVEIAARHGVVLAGGGFPASAQWRERELPLPTPLYTPAAPGCDGSSIALGLSVGGRLGPSGLDNALWFPSSVRRRRDGSLAIYPHIVLDRAKPGLIAVNAAGARFVNEAVSYHQFVRAMYAAHKPGAESVPAWLVCDRAFIRKYGLGLIRPRTPWLGRYLRDGYLHRGRTISELAGRIGLAADTLATTIERANRFADTGKDDDFGKGENLYDRGNGDAAHAPNPCLGRIGPGPYFAVALYPTPLGTSRGLVTDGDARVLDGGGRHIHGLYACGNDQHPAFEGEYPGAGAQLAQAMTFAWLAARHAARANAASNPIDPPQEI